MYRDLIKRNPENHSYYRQLEVAIGAESIEQKMAIYSEYREKHPKAQAPDRIPLDISEGIETFSDKRNNVIIFVSLNCR